MVNLTSPPRPLLLGRKKENRTTYPNRIMITFKITQKTTRKYGSHIDPILKSEEGEHYSDCIY